MLSVTKWRTHELRAQKGEFQFSVERAYTQDAWTCEVIWGEWTAPKGHTFKPGAEYFYANQSDAMTACERFVDTAECLLVLFRAFEGERVKRVREAA